MSSARGPVPAERAVDLGALPPDEQPLERSSSRRRRTLYAGGGIHSAIKNAKLTRDAAAYDLQTTIDTALLDVRTLFYNVLLAREKIRVEEENVKALPAPAGRHKEPV
jgi:hypothetical protein